jgi:hypothetical protein
MAGRFKYGTWQVRPPGSTQPPGDVRPALTEISGSLGLSYAHLVFDLALTELPLRELVIGLRRFDEPLRALPLDEKAAGDFPVSRVSAQ